MKRIPDKRLLARSPVLPAVLRYARRMVLTAGMPRLPLRVIKELPHDPKAFTQGLCYVGDSLLESTGLVGSSSLRRLDPVTGRLMQEVIVDGDWAEGVALTGGEVVQLSYRTGVARRYAWPGLQRLRPDYRYSGEGWGLVNVDGRLLMSNGTARLLFLCGDFRPLESIRIRRFGVELRRINDLAWDGKYLFANMLNESYLFRIDPVSASITGFVDCRPLLARVGLQSAEHVLNGISAGACAGEFYLTGKCWPILFKVKIGGE